MDNVRFTLNQYTECGICRLCEAISKPICERKIYDTLLEETDRFVWIPGLGSFIEGYSLIVSKSHVRNTGCLDIDIIDELEHFINKIKNMLRKVYKKGTVIFEHGSMGSRNCAGSCIEHQHIHILPADFSGVPSVLLNNFISRGPISSMKHLIELNQNHIPYIYYVPTSGIHSVFEARILPRQYLRQVVAAEYNCQDNWDWREKPFLDNIISFVTKIRELRRE